MPIFRPLASLAYEEEEVIDGRMDATPFLKKNHNEISNLPLCSLQEG